MRLWLCVRVCTLSGVCHIEAIRWNEFCKWMNQFVDQVVRLAYFYFIIIIIIILPALSESRCFESSNSNKFRQKMTMTTAECTDYNRDKTNGLLITLYTFLHTNKRSSIKTKKKKPTNGNPERERREVPLYGCRDRRLDHLKNKSTHRSAQLLYYFQVD